MATIQLPQFKDVDVELSEACKQRGVDNQPSPPLLPCNTSGAHGQYNPSPQPDIQMLFDQHIELKKDIADLKLHVMSCLDKIFLKLEDISKFPGKGDSSPGHAGGEGAGQRTENDFFDHDFLDNNEELQRGYSVGTPEGQQTRKGAFGGTNHGLAGEGPGGLAADAQQMTNEHLDTILGEATSMDGLGAIKQGLAGGNTGGLAADVKKKTDEHLDTVNEPQTETLPATFKASLKKFEKTDVFADGFNPMDMFAFDDLPLTNTAEVSAKSGSARLGTGCAKTAREIDAIPIIDVDSGFDDDFDLTESQWQTLESKAVQKVKLGKKVPAGKVEIIQVDETHQEQRKVLPTLNLHREAPAEQNLVQEVTPHVGARNVRARIRKPAKYNRSPFTNEFGSAESSSKLGKRRVLSLHHPFVSEIGQEIDYQLVCRFSPWIDFGACPRSKKKAYPPEVNNLDEEFDFGVYVVRKKDWFHVLNYGTKALSTTHLDVLFYYFRKMCKYDADVVPRITTTDCLFDSKIRNVYNEYIAHNKQLGVVDSASMITDCICGRHLRCNTPWVFADEILFPVMVVEAWHWILVRMSFKDRVMYVYDSFKNQPEYNKQVIQAVDPYATMIPLFLSSTGFYSKRKELFCNGSPYVDKALSQPFPLEFVTEPPSSSPRDYTLIAAAFAEYYIKHQRLPHPDEDLSDLGNRYAALLWDYGSMKQIQAAHSDCD